jgi:uncharacterized membrane protein
MAGFTDFVFKGQIELPPDPKRKALELQLQRAQEEAKVLRRANESLKDQLSMGDVGDEEPIRRSRQPRRMPSSTVTLEDRPSRPTGAPPPPRPALPVEPHLRASTREQTQSSVVKILTWTMVTTLLLSLIGVVALTVLEKNVPDILTVGVSSPLGYFGGMLSAYFGIHSAGAVG